MADIIIAGVGGQGTLLASKIIGNAAITRGFDVKVSEVHGMSQRGGSVVTYVRYSRNPIESPIIELGQADIVIAFELLEGYRAYGYLKKEGKLIINTQKIPPAPVMSGKEAYPDDIIKRLNDYGINYTAFDAAETARQTGSAKMVNTVMIGKMAQDLDIPREAWLEAVGLCVKPQFVDMNIKAFELGFGR